jgi:hypothetical protein
MGPARTTLALVPNGMNTLAINLSPVKRLRKFDVASKSVLEHSKKSILIELLMQPEKLLKLLVSLTPKHLIFPLDKH